MASKRSKQSQQQQMRHQRDQICCPVWTLVMNQLDSRQGQPREQGSVCNLIGPPSTQSFLMATKDEPTSELSSLSDQGPKVYVSGISNHSSDYYEDSSDGERFESGGSGQLFPRRSSNESAEKARSKAATSKRNSSQAIRLERVDGQTCGRQITG